MKVVLLGDSIRMFYGKAVIEKLGEGYEVWQPSENCRFAQYTLRGVYDWRDNMKDARIIHWNNGLWDECDLFGDGCFTPLAQYCETMCRLGKLLKERADIVIFATTTPVHPNRGRNRNENILRYNAAVVPLLQDMGIRINDLHSTVWQNVNEYICEDLIHPSPKGVEVLSQQVADAIRTAAKELK